MNNRQLYMMLEKEELVEQKLELCRRVERLEDDLRKSHRLTEGLSVQLTNTRRVYTGNSRILIRERDESRALAKEMKQQKEQAEQQVISLTQELRKAEEKIYFAQKKMEIGESVIVKLKQAHETLLAEKNEELKAKMAATRLRPFDSLVNKECKKRRVEEQVDHIQQAAGSKHLEFCKRIVDGMGERGLMKTTLTPLEAFRLYHSARMTRYTFRKVKKNLKVHHIQDPFPSIKKIMEIESGVASDDIYNNYNVSTIDGEGRVREVTVSEMRDVRGFLTKRVQQLLHAGIFDGDFLWLSITGDKGGAEFKLCFSIGNVPKPNSVCNLTPLGMFDDDESAENILKYLGNVVEKVNELKEIEVERDGCYVKLPVKQFLCGDLKFQYEMLGHQGAASKCHCMYCYVDQKPKIGTYTRGMLVEERSAESYKADSEKDAHSNSARRNVKFQSEFVFKLIPMTQIIPPSLHIVMGLAQKYGFDVLQDIARNEDNNSQIPLGKAKRSAERKAKADLQNIQNKLATLKNFQNSMGILKEIVNNFECKKVDAVAEGLGCAARRCLVRDKAWKKVKAYDARKVVCGECLETFHGVCCGAWKVEEWELTGDPDEDFFCFDCTSTSDDRVKRRLEDVAMLLKKEIEEMEEDLKLKQEDWQKYIVASKGGGLVQKSLEDAWKSVGADMSVWQQNFCGNDVLKLLDESAIEKYTTVLKPSTDLEKIKKFLVALGKIQRLCVARSLTDDEIDELNDYINRVFAALQMYAPDEGCTPKLHVLLEHVIPFCINFKTWAKTSEQSIEALHANVNYLHVRHRTIRNSVAKRNFVMCHILFRNLINDTS